MEVTINENNIHFVLKQFEQKVAGELHQDVNAFRGKMNTLIHETPTGELRNSYTDMNILFEKIVNDYSFLLKNK